MQKYNNFSLTGFKDQEIETKLKDYLLKLGCRHIEKLSQNTNILIVGATWTQKFKIAQLHKTPIPCVTKKWVEDSYKKKTLQAPDKYLITEKQLFLGTHIALCGFPPEKQDKLQKIIKEKKGSVFTTYKAADIIRKNDEIPEIIDLILASKDQVQRAKHARLPDFDDDKSIVPPLVRIEWLQDSFKSKRCKFPEDYAVNLIKRKSIHSFKSRLTTKLGNFLQNDTMDKSGDFLENTLIFIDKDLTMDMVILFKNLISVCGGYWTDVFSSVVTHVLVLQIDEEKDQHYKKYGSRIYILRPQWLVDSIFLYNRLPEQDYLIRVFKPKGKLLKNLIQEEHFRNNQNSQNFNSLQEDFGTRLLLNTNTLPNLQIERKNSKTQHKSSVFQGRDFYVPPELMEDSSYDQIKKMIKNAGGTLYHKINSKITVYVILKDSHKNKEIIQNIKKAKYICHVLSQRWVKDCIKKNERIKPERTFWHYEAFCFTTPMPDFHRFIFEIIGYDDLSKVVRIRQLIQTFGSKRTNPNKSQVTHVICGPHWRNNESTKIIHKIMKQNSKFKLINVQWLFDCKDQCKIVNFQPYVIENPELQNQTPCKIQESIQSNSDKKTTQTEIIKLEFSEKL